MTWPVTPLCHNGREVVTQVHAHTHTRTPFQLLDQNVREGDEDAERPIKRERGREIDFLFTGEKSEVLFTDLRAI